MPQTSFLFLLCAFKVQNLRQDCPFVQAQMSLCCSYSHAISTSILGCCPYFTFFIIFSATRVNLLGCVFNRYKGAHFLSAEKKAYLKFLSDVCLSSPALIRYIRWIQYSPFIMLRTSDSLNEDLPLTFSMERIVHCRLIPRIISKNAFFFGQVPI